MANAALDHHDEHGAHNAAENAKFAMWLYIASETILFTVFIGAYAVFRFAEPGIIEEFREHAGFSGLLLVTFNSFLLLASSWAMVMGLREIQRDNKQGLIQWLGLTAVLGTAFVILQYVEYQTLGAEGITLDFASDRFDGFGMHFYAPTAFHGAHVILGVLWCLETMRRGAKGNFSSKNYVFVEVFGLYWHFVDVVWVVLFTLIYLI